MTEYEIADLALSKQEGIWQQVGLVQETGEPPALQQFYNGRGDSLANVWIRDERLHPSTVIDFSYLFLQSFHCSRGGLISYDPKPVCLLLS